MPTSKINQIGTDNAKIKKTIQKFYKFTKICAKRVYNSPTPKSYNVLIGSRGAATNNKNTKT